MDKSVFMEALNDKSISDSEIVDKFITFGTPYIFKDDEHLYFELKNVISKYFGISPLKVMMAGSAKLGFSISPTKRYRDIQDDSDIDIVIICNELFDDFWVQLFELNINLTSRTIDEEKTYHRFLNYFFSGWLRPDLFPFQFKGKDEWFGFFRSISYNKYAQRKIAGAIYKNEFFYKKYHENNIKTMRPK